MKLKFVIISFMFCFVLSSLMTVNVAQDMQLQMKQEVQNFLSYADHLDAEHLETSAISNLRLPYQMIHLEKAYPFILPHLQSYSSNDCFFGNWSMIYGFEAALSYYSSDMYPLLKQGNYLSFEYTTEENWTNRNIETTGTAYLNLDSLPEWKQDFSSSPLGLLSLSSFLRVLKITGTFDNNELIPVSIENQEFIDTYHPTSEPDIQHISELEDRNLLKWENLYQAESSHELTTIYAYNLDGYCYDYESFDIHGKSMTLPQLLDLDVQTQSKTNISSLSESIETFHFQNTDGIIIAFALRYWPLQYAITRLIPTYLILLLLNLCLLKILNNKSKRGCNKIEKT